MKKIIFGIFAHPDDEAFGPAATLLHETKHGAELHLICLTAGEAGVNPDNHDDLAAVRLQEWRTSGALIGAASMHHLGYIDGRLCNNDYHEIAGEITKIFNDIVQSQTEPVEIEFMSMDFNGVTGHIDHIVAARVAAFVFYQQRELDRNMTRMLLSCVPRSEVPKPNTDWLYMDAGRDENICQKVDFPELYNQVIEIMRVHHSQRNDGETHIKSRGDGLTTNYFMVLD
jgi:LmbE family N-acetylglucosaminyl deacetylase